ncbi:MAG: DUF1501 domain-containing protein [Rhodobacteraceae bacterium]|nr:DUF1501 domain-containing protein [Paracoccaceae bacterium]
MTLSRRKFMINSTLLGCSAAASPLLTPLTLAAAPGDNRLVVIVLRGAMDGLDVVRPYGDPDFARQRPSLGAGEGAGDLDGFFSLNEALADLMPLWRARELGFVQAVSTPYRDKRSHFDGQDLLESGSNARDGAPQTGKTGWLNRALALMPGAQAETAFSVGQSRMLLLDGPQPYAAWSPGSDLAMSAQTELLLARIYADDPLFASSAEMAMELSGKTDDMAGGGRRGAAKALASFAAARLNEETRIASFSIGGWDTHNGQRRNLVRALKELSEAILELKSGLGSHWQRTTVLAITEFGRTVAENGTAGTDHGTGGLMVMAGGAINGGKVFGQWPGLGELDLYQNRDLEPTADVRRYLGWALRDLFDLEASALGSSVFPGLDMGHNAGIIA